MRLSIQMIVIIIINNYKFLFFNQLFKTKRFPFAMLFTLDKFLDYVKEQAESQ